ncbi:sensor histidine kinase [Sphingobacterium lumbrici]|uniref:sensor histidine kinase n=1 Tax=Sphingobacterium lumbrici TaxID=2559600 RepID=UPI00112E3478|nr:sensor histidine kinase [Sphingobacterium lumbrici]
MATRKLKYTNACSQYMKLAIMMTKRTKIILMHLGIWAIYWCVELLKLSFAFNNVFIERNLLTEIIINLLSGTAFFYALILFVFPPKADRIQVFQLLWRLALAWLVCMALRRCGILLMAEWIDFKSPVVTNLKFFFVSGFDLFTRFGIYAALIWFFRRQGELQKQMLQKKLEEEKLKHELLETKHAVLKAQINPHFLFNILNFIHSKAISADDHVIDKTVLLLSDILRHSLQDHKSDHPVLVNDELLHIKKLNELNSLRFNGKYYFNIIDEGAAYQNKIPALILLTFFENAMKYGIFNDPQYPVVLHVKQSPDLLEIDMKNKIDNTTSTNKKERHAIGKRYINNILDKFYKNNCILEYHNDGVFYIVNLKIIKE